MRERCRKADLLLLRCSFRTCHKKTPEPVETEASPFIRREAGPRHLIRMSRIVKRVDSLCIFQLAQPFTGTDAAEKTIFLKKPHTQTK